MLQIQVSSRKPIKFTPPVYANKKWHTWYDYDYSQDIKGKKRLEVENGG